MRGDSYDVTGGLTSCVVIEALLSYLNLNNGESLVDSNPVPSLVECIASN